MNAGTPFQCVFSFRLTAKMSHQLRLNFFYQDSTGSSPTELVERDEDEDELS